MNKTLHYLMLCMFLFILLSDSPPCLIFSCLIFRWLYLNYERQYLVPKLIRREFDVSFNRMSVTSLLYLFLGTLPMRQILKIHFDLSSIRAANYVWKQVAFIAFTMYGVTC